MPQGFKHFCSYESMGTRWELSVWVNEDNATHVDMLFEQIQKMSAEFDITYSRFIPTSRILRDFSKPGIYTVEPRFVEILLLYQAYSRATHGKINPLIGKALSEAGYDETYQLSNVSKDIPDTPDFLEAVEILNDKTIQINEEVIIDIGALGKGYFVDVIVDFLRKNGVKCFLVNGSGDMYFYNEDNPDDTLVVGLEHPQDEKKIIGTTLLGHKMALCSSGTNRRFWGKFHHILDPHSKSSPTEVISSWVKTSKTAHGDAIATALFFSSSEEIRTIVNFDYALLSKDLSLSYSKNFHPTLF